MSPCACFEVSFDCIRPSTYEFKINFQQILPLCLSLAYLFLLPPSSEDLPHHLNNHGYEALTATEDGIEISSDRPKNALSLRQKLELTRPLILPFMLPLFSVYFAEYSVSGEEAGWGLLFSG